jgi:signal transduction histidine kinase/ActR/RegA family two-component response regulator
MEALAPALEEAPGIANAWQRRDRAELLQGAAPFLEAWRARFGISHCYFIAPDKTCFLRVHQPDQFGDTIQRYTMAKAATSFKPEHGLELGPLGTLTLRMVAPWRINGELTGFVELGMDVQTLTPTLAKVMGTDLFWVVSKESIQKAVARLGDSPAAPLPGQERFDNAVLMAGSAKEVPAQLVAFINQPHAKHKGQIFLFSEKGRDWNAGQLPLIDAGGNTVGGIFIIDDISAKTTALRALLYGLLLITAGIGGVLFAGFFLLTGRIERRLLKGNETLRQERDAHALTAKELAEHKHHLEKMVAEKTSALVASNKTLQQEIIEHRDAKKRWERTFDAMGDIVTIHDTEMHIIRANRATKEMLGLGWRDLIGKHCYEVFRGENAPCPGCPEVPALRDFQLHTAEIEHPRLNKSFLVTASPLFDEQGRCEGIIHVAKDITEQQLLTAKLRQAQKMEAVGTLAGGVAHDFNNILTGILGYAELARMSMPADSPLYRDLSEVLALGKRGANLVRQLLTFSRQQAMETVDLDLNKLITNLMKLLHRLIPENIKVEFTPGPDLLRIRADKGQLEQVMVNLAVNARDAMPEGGRLVIETANVEANGNDKNPHPSLVRLRVSDTGTGMDKAMHEQIFEPFFTTKETGKGTGLGLSLVYSIVKQHEGWIELESAPNQGTTFSLFFPADQAGDAHDDTAAADKAPRGSETILLVEDEKPILRVVTRTLENLGYTVLATADPREAEAIFQRSGDDIDLLLSDLVMPDCNGHELYERLAAHHPRLKVLFMSGYPDKVMTTQSMQGPAFAFIGKPFSMEALAKTLRQVLDMKKKG